MRMVLTDWGNGVWRWVLPVVLLGILLVLIRGPTVVIAVGAIGIPILSLVMIGLLGAVAKTPFSFCLPGFRESLRRRYFIAAAVMGLGGALFALDLVPHLHRVADAAGWAHVSLPVACGFLVGMAVALIMGTSCLVLPGRTWGIPIPFLILPVVIAPVFFMLLADSSGGYPTIAIPEGTVVCVLVWLRLGDLACVKRGHRRIIEHATQQGRETATELRAHPEDAVTVPPWADSLFRGWMHRRPYLSAGRYIWGAFYEAFGLWFSYWESILFAIAAAALVLGLLGNDMVPFIALIYFAFSERVIRLPMTSTLLLPGGRREKCYATFATALAASLLLLGAAVVVVALARVGVLLVSGAFPEGAGGLADRTTGPAGIFLPCVLVPTTLGIQLMRRERRRIAWIAWVLSFASLNLAIFPRSAWQNWLVLWMLVAMFVFGWVFFLLALRAACRRWDLG